MQRHPQQLLSHARTIRNPSQVWRQHWDFQLYKALEYQYIQVRSTCSTRMRVCAVRVHISAGTTNFKMGCGAILS